MDFVELLKAILLGVVEGFTEWLPISSTAHTVLVNEIVSLNGAQEYKDFFMVLIQLGAVAAVCVLFGKKLNPFEHKKSDSQKKATWILWSKIGVAVLPITILGIISYDWIRVYRSSGIIISSMLILYGIVFIIIENNSRLRRQTINKLGDISYPAAFYLGVIQSLALIPGTGRAGTLILGAILLGFSKSAAVEFSLYVGLPVIIGESLIEIFKYTGTLTFYDIVYLIVGATVAFFVANYSIRFLISWIRKKNFKLFGYYRIILGAIVIIWFALKNFIA